MTKPFKGTDFNPSKLPFKWVALIFGILLTSGAIYGATQIKYGGLMIFIVVMFAAIGIYLLIAAYRKFKK